MQKLVNLQEHIRKVDADIANSALHVRALEAALKQERERLLRLDGMRTMLATLASESNNIEEEE